MVPDKRRESVATEGTEEASELASRISVTVESVEVSDSVLRRTG